jgi:ABC-type transport system substrate-binding protein
MVYVQPALGRHVARGRTGMMRRGTMAAWVAGVALAVAAWVAPVAAQPAGTVVVGLVAEPVNLDPAQVTDLNSARVGRRVVETLVTFPDESTQVIPGLAESWTIGRDGLSYTFKLRRGIRFHDGTPLNAAAVKFSIERQIIQEHPAYKLGKYPFASYFFGNVKAVEAMDRARCVSCSRSPAPRSSPSSPPARRPS